MSRHALIRLALDALSLSRAAAWLPAALDAAGFIVTLHHVRPARLSPFDPNGLLSITPEFLDRFLRHFISKGWRFVALDEIVSGSDTDSRRIAVTLDDGYRNNAEHAAPVFRRHGVPFTIFICPGFCDRTSELWWEALERIIAGTDSLALEGEGPAAELSTRTLDDKRKAFRLWTRWLTTTADEVRQRTAIRGLARKYGFDLAALARELVMDWDEVRAIAADPLCSIGAHTVTHPALARLAREQALREMRESADRIEAEIARRPQALAFPYGYLAAAGPREADLAQEAGFTASVTTRPGFVPSAGSRHGLKRVSVNGLFQQEKYLDVLLTPGLWKLSDRVRRTAR